MLPYDNTNYFTPAQMAALNMANDSQAVPESDLFAAGDVRANENIELTALQTLFMRNHNRIANELHAAHPGWSDEQLFQEARKLNIAQYQSIVYNEWIPAVLGVNALPGYTGYKPNVNATIANEFSTVAFRFGHSLLSANIERQTNQGTDIADAAGDSSIPLAEDFFDPYLLNPAGVTDPLTGHTSSDIGAILKGDADGDSQAMDPLAVEDVRNLLFGNGGLGGAGPHGSRRAARPRQRHPRLQHAPRRHGSAAGHQLRANHPQRAGPAGTRPSLPGRRQHDRRVRRRPGRGPRRRLRRRPALPGDHGQPVHATARRRPVLLPQRELQPRGTEHPARGQHPDGSDRGEHQRHQFAIRRLPVPRLH